MSLRCLEHIPSMQHGLPTTLNFFFAANGPNRSLAVAGRQTCYGGARSAKCMHNLQLFQQDEPIYNNNAHTIISPTKGIHCIPLGYTISEVFQSVMTYINTWAMDRNVSTSFR
ncbi:hypothetical protein GQ44DRAFT_631469 [Phaeosphaeriaceae sp. PMI808]|nr:hypothetical protein GQ44DRAFT_631469 [Phaeosphaeriaceae sp. PMI808]